jgi:hypothetical protein
MPGWVALFIWCWRWGLLSFLIVFSGQARFRRGCAGACLLHEVGRRPDEAAPAMAPAAIRWLAAGKNWMAAQAPDPGYG